MMTTTKTWTAFADDVGGDDVLAAGDGCGVVAAQGMLQVGSEA